MVRLDMFLLNDIQNRKYYIGYGVRCSGFEYFKSFQNFTGFNWILCGEEYIFNT